MLDEGTVRVLAALMAAGTVAGLAAVALRGRRERVREFRAQDDPPEVLQVVWPLVNVVPQVYPFLVAAIPGVAYAWLPRFSFPGDTYVQLAGLLLWGFGGLLVLWAERVLDRYMTIRIAVARDHELIERGPYGRIRHPTYTGAMSLALGTALAFLSWTLLALAFITIAIAHYRAFKEERLLSSPMGFGERYRAYMMRTGRFLPRARTKASSAGRREPA